MFRKTQILRDIQVNFATQKKYEDFKSNERVSHYTEAIRETTLSPNKLIG